MAEVLGVDAPLATLLHDLFFVYLYMGRQESAFAVLREALELFRALGNLPMLAETLVFTCYDNYNNEVRFLSFEDNRQRRR